MQSGSNGCLPDIFISQFWIFGDTVAPCYTLYHLLLLLKCITKHIMTNINLGDLFGAFFEKI